MSITVFIPARMGSKRFPGKILAPIAGKPLIRRACETASRAAGVDRVVVATDEPEVIEAVEGLGLEAILTGPEHTCGTDRIAEAARNLGLGPEEIAVNFQGDQPLCPPTLIEDAVRPLLEEPELGMATVAIPLTDHQAPDPGKVKIALARNNDALYFSRSPIPHARDAGTHPGYLKHLGVYAFRMSFLQTFAALPKDGLETIEKLEQLRALEHGYPIRVSLTEVDSPSVDSPEDVAEVEAILAERGE